MHTNLRQAIASFSHCERIHAVEALCAVFGGPGRWILFAILLVIPSELFGNQVRVRLEVTDLNGDPIPSVPVGDNFLLRGLVEDLRPFPEGVFAATVDVFYNPNLVGISGPIIYDLNYPNGRTGDTTVLAGIIDEVGAFSGFAPLGGGEFPLFAVPFRADRGGLGQFTLNRPDARGSRMLVYGANTPVSFDDVTFVDAVVDIEPSSVVGEHVFYNGSVFDTAGAGVDDAIAPDKNALTPGETAAFENYTNFDRGLTAIAIDVQDLARPEQVGIQDLEFRVGNDDSSDAWPRAPGPVRVAVHPGEGRQGSDRLTVVWNDHAIQNEWLETRVLANGRTGLSTDHVFYFGNAIGDTGDSPHHALVDGTDFIVVRDQGVIDPVAIDNPFDFNRDGRIDDTDLGVVLDGSSDLLTALSLITPSVSAVATMVVPEPSVRILFALGVLILTLFPNGTARLTVSRRRARG